MRKTLSDRLMRVGVGSILALAAVACQSSSSRSVATTSADSQARAKMRRSAANAPDPIRRIVCLYDQRPWLNVDTAGDADPEGVRFRLFLDPGTGRGELRDGTFHIKMYQIERLGQGEVDRTLVSDWHYSTSDFQQVKSRLLGMGYHLRLRWAKKEVAGAEVELITSFEDSAGRSVRSGTKRLRIPKYGS